METDKTPDTIITEAVDLIALGYPLEGTDVEKEEWFQALRKLVELRAPEARAQVRQLVDRHESRRPKPARSSEHR